MLKKLWQFLNKPIGYFDLKPISIIINTYCRYDFPEVNDMKLTEGLIEHSAISNLRELCSLYFSLVDDNVLVVLQDYSKKQPEYTIISEKTVPNDVMRKLYNYLPDGMIVYFAFREIIYTRN